MPPSQALFMVRHLSSSPAGLQDEMKLQGLARRAGRCQGRKLPMWWAMPEQPVKDGAPAVCGGMRDRGGCAPARPLTHRPLSLLQTQRPGQAAATEEDCECLLGGQGASLQPAILLAPPWGGPVTLSHY